jgi:hypothetical protein
MRLRVGAANRLISRNVQSLKHHPQPGSDATPLSGQARFARQFPRPPCRLYPETMAPVVHTAQDGEREPSSMRWGFPPPPSDFCTLAEEAVMPAYMLDHLDFVGQLDERLPQFGRASRGRCGSYFESFASMCLMGQDPALAILVVSIIATKRANK